MYKFGPIDSHAFAWFPVNILESRIFAKLRPHSAKTVYPVLLSYAPHGIAYPSQSTLADVCGMTEKSIAIAVRAIESSVPGFQVFRHVTRTGVYRNEYHLQKPARYRRGNAFPFRRCILEGGNWRKTPPVAHAMYLSMLSFAFHDQHGEFSERKHEICHADKEAIKDRAGIGKRTVPVALKALQDNGLIEAAGEIEDRQRWKVYLTPSLYHDREELNREIARRHGQCSRVDEPA